MLSHNSQLDVGGGGGGGGEERVGYHIVASWKKRKRKRG